MSGFLLVIRELRYFAENRCFPLVSRYFLKRKATV